MKISNSILTAVAIIALAMLTSPAIQAQTCDGTGTHFVDLDGDGFNDNAPDHDGDGIPNGLDPDYVKYAQDGSGLQKGKLGENKSSGTTQTMSMTMLQKFNHLQAFFGNMFQKRLGALGGVNGSGAGVCDGTGSQLNGGSGLCDGTGPHGTQKQSGK